MRLPVLTLAATTAILLSGCGRDEEPVANRFERQKAEIENKARALEAQVENDVGAAESQLENEADALLNSLRDGDASETNEEGNASR